ncbi:MAG: YbaN family protein [Ruminococcus sp.]|nr:YbaN family protein [Ruminococcus sp.]
MKRIILLIFGVIFLILGGIGILIPILPTTPFVLLSAGCFSASPRVYKVIYRIRFFREYLDSYKKGTPIRTRVRVISIAALWLTLGLSMFFSQKPILFIILPIVGVAVTIHLLTIGRKGKPIEEIPAENSIQNL